MTRSGLSGQLGCPRLKAQPRRQAGKSAAYGPHMIRGIRVNKTIYLGSATLVAAMLVAPSGAMAQGSSSAPARVSASDASLAQFTPRPASQTRLDFAVLDAALDSFVLRMGRSLREGAPRPNPGLGSRVSYGHDSRYRLEGNRVGFGFIEPEAIAALSEYRADLERIADQVDIAGLPRNEQLAYWINLHNVALIEQIALAYPVSQPSQIRLAGSNSPLDETRFIAVAGVRLSPKDIRTRIVYPNWQDPKVIYGFFRGEIGGPSIQSRAYNGTEVAEMLGDSAKEFVNSLRGTQKSGDTLQVSEIYAEARPFYFPDWPTDLRRHILEHSEEEVAKIVNDTKAAEATIYDRDIADLSKGKPSPGYNTIYSDGIAQGTRIPSDVIRLLSERQQKREKAILRGDERVGRVIVLPFGTSEEEKKPVVVE